MSDHTPTVAALRRQYAAKGLPPYTRGKGAEFDRAIEQVRATARRDALNEAAEFAVHPKMSGNHAVAPERVAEWLRARAASQ